MQEVSGQMDEPRKSDESQSPPNASLDQQTFMNLIFETAPVGLAVVKSPELIFQLVNPAYQKYVPAADVNPLWSQNGTCAIECTANDTGTWFVLLK